jgi:hypothetical protein
MVIHVRTAAGASSAVWMEAVYKGIDWDGVSMTFGLDAVITATVVACALVTNDLVVRHELLGSSGRDGAPPRAPETDLFKGLAS